VTEGAELLGPRSVGNCGLLIKTDRSMIMPTNKVIRYLRHGNEHATQAYVSAFAGASPGTPSEPEGQA
jgi:hypothetical protein